MTDAPITRSLHRLLDQRSKQRLLCAVDAIVMAGGALSAPLAFAGVSETRLALALLLGAIGVGVMRALGVYRGILSESDPIQDWWRYAVASGASVGAYELIVGESVRVVLLGVGATFAILVALRLAARRSRYAANESAGNRIAIYGAGQAGIQLSAALDRSPDNSVRLFVDDDEKLWGRTISGRMIVRPDQLRFEIVAHAVTDLIVTIPSLDERKRKSLIERLVALPVRVSVAPTLRELMGGQGLTMYRPLRVEELLGREPVAPIQDLAKGSVEGECVMVTGAGGSIGSELCRQISSYNPRKLVLIDTSECALYEIDRELRKMYPVLEIAILLGNVTEQKLVSRVLANEGVTVIFHAAAYKHVPLVETNVIEGIRNNVFGTLNLVEEAERAAVRKFVLVSTDKAVRPTNVMGASKRICELILQGRAARNEPSQTIYCMVRFGNVLGSSGSVVPLFNEQIDNGGPVTLTHPDITRYFMSISEAAGLVLQAATLAHNGDVFVLDMGKPVRIADLAKAMIHQKGFVEIEADKLANRGISIEITGLRPGEKLYEELFLGQNPSPTMHPKIMRAREDFLEWNILTYGLNQLKGATESADINKTKEVLAELVTGLVLQNLTSE
jgi:FlaA1/EpsC-like NDP-sugar epimerase